MMASLIVSSFSPSTLLSLILFVFILLKASRAFADPLRDVPGPFLARFSRLWLFWGFYSRRWNEINCALHDKYGPIVRVAPGQYSIDDASATKVIYAHGSKFPKSDWYIPFNAKPEGLFGTRDFAHHAMLRRKLQGAYSMSALKAYEPYVRECVELYTKQLDSLHGRTMDLMHWNHGFAFDVIGMITFSHRFGFLDHGRDKVGFMTSIPQGSRNNMLIGVYPIVFPWIHVVLGLFYGKRVAMVLFEYVQAQMNRVRRKIKDEHLNEAQSDCPDDGPIDFISKLLRMEQDPENKKDITDAEVRLAAMTNVGAGSDSTGIAITAIIYYLVKYPEVLDHLRLDVQQARDDAGLVKDEIIPFAISKNIPYLQAVIKEAIRMHPASGVPLPRVVPADGAVLCEKYFPPGSVVMANAWVTHLDKDTWGDNAGVFDPERWLTPGATPAEVQNLSWGQGARSCIGRNIAEQQLNIVIPTLAMRYNFDIDTGRGNKIPTDCAVFAKPHNILAKISKS